MTNHNTNLPGPEVIQRFEHWHAPLLFEDDARWLYTILRGYNDMAENIKLVIKPNIVVEQQYPPTIPPISLNDGNGHRHTWHINLHQKSIGGCSIEFDAPPSIIHKIGEEYYASPKISERYAKNNRLIQNADGRWVI